MKRALVILSLAVACVAMSSCSKEQQFKQNFVGEWGVTLIELSYEVNGVPYGNTESYKYDPKNPGTIPAGRPPLTKMEVEKLTEDTFKVTHYTWNNDARFWGVEGSSPHVWKIAGNTINIDTYSDNYHINYSLNTSKFTIDSIHEYLEEGKIYGKDGVVTVKSHVKSVYERMKGK